MAGHQPPLSGMPVPPPAPPKSCSRCGHKPHSEPCKRLGRVECRWVTYDGGGALVRGQWPCGCQHLTA